MLKWCNTLVLGGLLLVSACVSTPPYKLPDNAAPVALAQIFTDHMVLQRELPVRIWGTANPGEPITVCFADQTRHTVADTNGCWSVRLAPMKACANPRDLVIRGHNEIVLKDILVGEVWLCSGQSNMEWGLLGVSQGRIDATNTSLPLLRFYSVEKQKTNVPLKVSQKTKGWINCMPGNLSQVGSSHGSFSATGFYFGYNLQPKLGIPVGLIQAAWGGTKIEPWTPSAIAGTDGSIYNAMVAPLVPMTIRGAIWYQGESNLGDRAAYEQKMKDLIKAWRQVFERPDMPFYFVEIAPFRYKATPEHLGELRAAQAKVAATVPHTGMIHTLDNPNDVGNIHPNNKPQTGARLARLALAKTYGMDVGKSVAGPVFAKATREGSVVSISFTETAGAMKTVDGKAVTGFEGQVPVAPGSNQWVKAEAEIRGDKLLVSVPGQTVSGIRFCWLQTEQSNLCNAEDLPPSPFQITLP